MEHTRIVTREFSTGDQAFLQLESRAGSVVVEGRDIDRVVIDATVKVWVDLPSEADDAASLVADAMQQDGARVIVRAPSLPKRDGWAALFSHGSRVDYAVQVPRHTQVRVMSKSGTVQIARLEGAVSTEALSGRLTIDDICGGISAVSRSGSLTVDQIDGDVQIESRSGRVTARQISGTLSIEARSGSVEARAVTGDVKVSARSGSVSLEDLRARLHVRTKAGSLRYRGKVLGDFDLEAVAGSITLAVDPDVPFFVDAESYGGSVRSDLPPKRGGGPPGEAGPKVRLRTKAGSIRLTRA